MIVLAITLMGELNLSLDLTDNHHIHGETFLSQDGCPDEPRR
jgi:hypothetical protein